MFVLLLGLLAAAGSIPFVYESTTLWYKTGIDRTLLRTGKIIGLAAFVLCGFQILFAAKLRSLDRILGLDRVFRLHWYNGLALTFLALTHALLILLPEGLDNLPFGWKHWPEMVGAALLTLLFGQVGTTLSQRRHGVGYSRWRRYHGSLGFLLLPGITLHVLWVSSSFAQGLPRTSLMVFSGAVLLGAGWARLAGRRHRSAGSLIALQPLNERLTALFVRPDTLFSHAAGQFTFLAFPGSPQHRHPHPFTIASQASEDASLRFIIRHRGEWTSSLRSLIPGTSVSLDGPFGLFSCRAFPAEDAYLMIAGGIGITPMLSMLHAFARTGQSPAITLIWSNRRRQDYFCGEELEDLGRKLPGLVIHLLFTAPGEGSGRLTSEQLDAMVSSCSRRSRVFLCGPTVMVRTLRRRLIALGFNRSRVHNERFALA